MTFLKIFCLFAVCLIVSGQRHFPNCRVSLQFSKVCHFYKFNDLCVPWDTSRCEKLRTTRDEFKCPKYRCVAEVIEAVANITIRPTATIRPAARCQCYKFKIFSRKINFNYENSISIIK